MNLEPLEAIPITEGHVRWIHVGPESIVNDIHKNGFQFTGGIISSTAVSCTTQNEVLNHLTELHSQSCDPRFKLTAHRAAVILDLPLDISKALNSLVVRHPQPAPQERRLGQEGDSISVVDPRFIRAVFYGTGRLEILPPPTKEFVDIYRAHLLSLQPTTVSGRISGKGPAQVTRPVIPTKSSGGFDIW